MSDRKEKSESKRHDMQTRPTKSFDDSGHGASDGAAAKAFFARYATLLNADDLSVFSTAFALVVADLSRKGPLVGDEDVAKIVLLEGMGRNMGADEIAEIALRRIRAPS
jgi:hypothetical protein